MKKRLTPGQEIGAYLKEGTDDAGRVGDVLVFVHRWRSLKFDPFTFARANTFLVRLTRMIRWQGFAAEPYDPLSPNITCQSWLKKQSWVTSAHMGCWFTSVLARV